MAAQISQDEKVKKADWIIRNEAEFEDLTSQVSNLVEQIRLTQDR